MQSTLQWKLFLDPLHRTEIHTFAVLCPNRSLCLLAEFETFYWLQKNSFKKAKISKKKKIFILTKIVP